MNEPPIESSQPTLTAEEANWAMVRSSLASMAQAQSEFFQKMDQRLHVQDQLLVGRFNGLDAILEKQQRELSRYNSTLDRGLELLENLNTIVAGMRSASGSNYDMVTSVARKLERLRVFLNVPDAILEEPPAESRERTG